MNTPTQEQWSRRRLLTILTLTCLLALVLMAGLGLAVREALQPTPEDGSPAAETIEPVELDGRAPETAAERRAALASAPMLEVPPQAAVQGGAPAATPAEVIQIPAATSTGPVGVPTGFPQTPEGAVGQLAAIDTTVLHAMSIPVAHDVHAAWSQEGAVEAEEWMMTQNVQAFLASAQQMGQAKSTGVRVSAVPVGAQIKGSDGSDWVVACVLLDVRAVIKEQAQIAYGHCEAMTWQHDRWVIATGPAPAPAPSTWPGTDLAAQAGWQTWAPDNHR